jgi:hypothetical protein
MRAVRQYERRLGFEQLETRALLSASPIKIAPLASHSSSTHVARAAKVGSAAVAQPAVAAPVPGDLNFDGKINTSDIRALLQALTDKSGYEAKYQVDDTQWAIVADVNQDDVVNNADLQALLTKLLDQPPPPVKPPVSSLLVAPTLPFSAATVVTLANNIVRPVESLSAASAGGAAGIFVPGPSVEAVLGGGGGDAQAAPAAVSSNGPPMPTHARGADIALIAYSAATSGGGDQVVQGMLMNLADVEEPRMLAIEYGDEAVKREVTVNKAVVTAPVEEPKTEHAAGDQVVSMPVIVAEPVKPVVEQSSDLFRRNFWWLMATAVGVAGAAAGGAGWWVYRRKTLEASG